MKIPFMFFVSAFVVLISVSRAEAHHVCILNHTTETQDVTLRPPDGVGFTLRALPSGNACVDVGPEWRPFDFSVEKGGGDSCSGQRIWPSTWLRLEESSGEVQCAVRADGKPGLKDYSVKVNVRNYDDREAAYITQGASNCGYFEWMPVTLKKKESTWFPMRIVNTGSCFFETTYVNINVKGPNPSPSTLTLSSSAGGRRCDSGGAFVYFWIHCYATDNYMVDLTRLHHKLSEEQEK